jgi:hypothetical protein
MDFFDLLWEASHTRDIREVRHQIEQIQHERDLHEGNARNLVAENDELKYRLALLVRLLIEKGLITAEEYASLIAKTK